MIGAVGSGACGGAAMAKNAALIPIPSKGGPGPILGTALDTATDAVKPAIAWAVVFGLFITLLAFIGPLYMMNLYERVLSSRNETTLAMLTLVVIFALLILAFLEAIRADMMRRASVLFDHKLSGPTFDAIQRAIVRRPLDASLPTLRDLDSLRELIAGSALTSLLDLIWFPLFLIACLILHPVFAVLALVSAGVIAGLTFMTSRATSEPIKQAGKAQHLAARRASAAFQNFEAVQSMGMRPAMRRGWQSLHEAALGWQVVADDRSMLLRTLSGFSRSISQTATLAIAAFLVLHKDLSPGQIFAVSIIVGKATQPLQQIATQWKAIAQARQAYERIQAMLRDAQPEAKKMSLPRPRGELSALGLVVSAPGRGVDQIILRAVSFQVPAGGVLAIIGASASGKSSLLRVMLNVWKPLAGEFRLDGTDIRHWNDEALARYVGYLPQTIELFPGTVEQNIARFGETGHEAVIAAARRAGAHDMIQHLPEGYNTEIGEQGVALSGGQRQRIGLARALFGNPSIVLLDEPNANLDAQGEDNLMLALAMLREAGKTVVLVTHKIGLVAAADYVLVLGNGTVKSFGERAEILPGVTQPRALPVSIRAG
jgi:ATP-binding cassette subfamily C protein